MPDPSHHTPIPWYADPVTDAIPLIRAAERLLEHHGETLRLAEIGERYDRALRAGVPVALAQRAAASVGRVGTPSVGALAPLVRGRAVTRVLVGPTGVGKSHAAAWALSRLGGSWAHGAHLHRYDDPAWGAMRSCRLVVIDELDAGHGAARVGQSVCDRHDSGRPTVITGNGGGDWWASVDPHGRLRSRLRADGQAHHDRPDVSRMGGDGLRPDLEPAEAIAAEIEEGLRAHRLRTGVATTGDVTVLLAAAGVTDDQIQGELERAERARREGMAAMAEAVLRAGGDHGL